jgi:pyruvate dehydrogenase E2 component (dihydrolipoamide acetyltransferase)
VAVIEVLVKAGDSVRAEQSLLTVESDKASMEIPSSHAGVVKELKVALGDKVSQGSLVLLLEVTGEAATTAPVTSAAPLASASTNPDQVPVQTAAAPVVGVSAVPSTGPVELRVPDIGDFKDVVVIEVMVKVGDAVKAEQSLITVESDKASMEIPASAAGVIAGPAALAQGGLRQVRPGRAQGPLAHQEDQRRQPAPQLGHDPARHQPRRRRHHRPGSLPRAATNKENEKSGVKVTMLAFMIKACVAALKKFPEFNSSLDGDAAGLQAVLPHRLCGRHAQRPGGAGDQGRRQEGHLPDQQEMGELAKKARDGKLSPADMRAAASPSAALGGIGGRYFTPIINAPEVPSWACARAPWSRCGTASSSQPRLMLPLSPELGPPRDRRRRRCALQRVLGQIAGRLPPHRDVTKGQDTALTPTDERHMAIIDIKVPDIGDFAEVAVIEVLVKSGDTIKAEQSLITVESDKASMEIPSSHAGVVKELQGQAGRQGRRGQRCC